MMVNLLIVGGSSS